MTADPNLVRLPDTPFVSSWIWLIVAALFVTSLVNSVFSITTATVRQAVIPDRVMAPVMAVSFALTSAAVALGALAGGLIGSKVSPGMAITVGGLVIVAAGLAMVGRKFALVESYQSSYLERLDSALTGISALRERMPTQLTAGSRFSLATRASARQTATLTAQCLMQGCPNHDVRDCAYVDRNGKHCPSTWCMDHVMMLEGRPFCRRHATLLRGLGLRPDQTSLLPPLDDWAASLTAWTAREFDGLLREELHARFPTQADIVVVAGRIVQGEGREGRFWTAPWVIELAEEPLLTLRLLVNEANDKMLILSIEGKEVRRGVPPWITRRHSLEDWNADDASADRDIFYKALLNPIRSAVASQL